MSHDWDKGRTYCSSCGSETEGFNHLSCPGSAEQQIERLVRVNGFQSVIQMVHDANNKIRAKTAAREQEQDLREAKRLKDLVDEGERAKIQLAKLTEKTR